MNKHRETSMASSKIILDKEAVHQNVNFVNSCLQSSSKVSAVVKGNAYGHGIEQMVPLFEEAGIGHFSVFSAHEAYRVLQVKAPTSEIMIMGWLADEDIEWAIKEAVSFYLFDLQNT